MIHQDYQHIYQILPARREESKLFQKVKHLDELSAKGFKYLQSSDRLTVQVKEDGVHCAVVVQPYYLTFRIGLFSRTGKAFTCVRHIVESLKEQALAGSLAAGVYFGELVNPNLTLEELSGLVNPNRKSIPEGWDRGEHGCLSLRLFDHITLTEFLDGYSDRGYEARLSACNFDPYSKVGSIMRQVETYFVRDLDAAGPLFQDVTESGGEGVVIRDAEAPWEAGHKGHYAVKRVRAIAYDLLCIGAESGKGKREGLVAKLLFRWRDGKTLKADLGKGWTDDKRPSIEDAGTMIGGVYRVYGLQDSSKGLIRLAKVGERRIDKTEPDY